MLINVVHDNDFPFPLQYTNYWGAGGGIPKGTGSFDPQEVKYFYSVSLIPEQGTIISMIQSVYGSVYYICNYFSRVQSRRRYNI